MTDPGVTVGGRDVRAELNGWLTELVLVASSRHAQPQDPATQEEIDAYILGLKSDIVALLTPHDSAVPVPPEGEFARKATLHLAYNELLQAREAWRHASEYEVDERDLIDELRLRTSNAAEHLFPVLTSAIRPPEPDVWLVEWRYSEAASERKWLKRSSWYGTEAEAVRAASRAGYETRVVPLYRAQAPSEPSDDESRHCGCQWVSPENGVIDQKWPAIIAPDCQVHGHESFRTHDRIAFDPSEPSVRDIGCCQYCGGPNDIRDAFMAGLNEGAVNGEIAARNGDIAFYDYLATRETADTEADDGE